MAEQFDADVANAKQHAKTIALLDQYALALEEISTAHNALAVYVQQLEKRIEQLEDE